MERVDLNAGLALAPKIRTELQQKYGIDVSRCYQCGKCTAGCPVSFAMKDTPRQIIRMLQVGLKEEALKSKTIWLCATCDTCSTRCPRDVDLARLMESLRVEAKARGMVAYKNNNLFNDIFLELVKRLGRVHEAGLIVFFNFLSRQFFKDVLFGPVMFLRGKIHILPKLIKDKGEVKRIFQRARALGGEGK